MRDVTRACLIALNFLVLASPHFFGSNAIALAAATLALLIINFVLAVRWTAPAATSTSPSRPAAIVIGAIAVVLSIIACHAWLREIVIFPIDAQRADMLVVIQQGLRRVMQGRNPYTIYHVPWEATLPYGPVLWGPFLTPFLLHADLRFASLIGELFVPVSCAIAAATLAARGRMTSAVAAMIVMAAIVFSPDLHGFASIAHTPSYWPLLAAFAWLVTAERWYAAAIVGGLLIVARTTMVAIAPVLMIAIWFRARPRFAAAAALLAGAAILPYLPFAVTDPRALAYALYGSYQNLMKTFVWTSTRWAHDTIGVTGLLLRAGGSRLVEPAQIAAMLAAYAGAWHALRRGSAPLPWMALALLVFSMTTLWPVHYIYFDVFLLLASGAVAEWFRSRIATAWTGTLLAALAIVVAMTLVDLPRDPDIDIGTGAARPLLYSGFADDEHGDRSFTWVDGERATILVPRRVRRDADVEIICQPNLPTATATQQMSAALNGIVLGTVALREGWQSVVLAAPARTWQIGTNVLTLTFSSAMSPREAGVSVDPRRLSAAFDRLTVRTR